MSGETLAPSPPGSEVPPGGSEPESLRPAAAEPDPGAWTSPPIGYGEWIVGLMGLAYTQLPVRNTISDVTVFALVSLVVALWWRDRLPARPLRAGGGRAELWLGAATLVSAGGLIGLGLYRDAPALGLGTALLVFAFYVPFALLQQWITLRYMVQRVAGHFARGNSLRGAVLGGVLFSLCHLPFPVLILPTLLTGVIWALAWRAGARLWTITLSHALLGSLLFVSVIDRDPFREIWALGA